ncbi:MAG: 16S rRNA (uracil(1498)-N(3))-methyltransferase [Propionibacteriaceae bacterium]|nr:16S rRNA (uracil(1498)-N(3))-methyltransferase [Propionibacteriaceae bacterium]
MSDGFFVADIPLTVELGSTVVVDGAEAHHMSVRRIRLGEVVTLTNGEGRGVTGVVNELGKDHAEVVVADILIDTHRTPRVTIVQALPKKDRTDQAIDLMTEVGVEGIIPWQASRSIVKWEGDKAETNRARWQKIARESSKQARRLSFPTIGPLMQTAEVVDLITASSCTLIMHEKALTPIAFTTPHPPGQCLIIIGPEGGLTHEEVEAFELAGGVTCSMGPTVLRTSTAGAVACVLAHNQCFLNHAMESR